jgi:hypothetical protein
MQDLSPIEPSEGEQSAYVTLTIAQSEVGVSRGTLKKYLAFLGIDPVCFHIGTRSLYISRNDLERVKHLKRNPSVLVHLTTAAKARNI